MKIFRFRLEPILTLRSWEEERARSACGQALQQEMRCAEILRAVEAAIESAVEAWRRDFSGAAPAGERAPRWRHLLGLERDRTDAMQRLLSARRVREQKMKALVEAHRKVRVLENVRTKQRQAHVEDARRREEKELDELVTARFQPDL
jgi:flagellar export protein FliJ